MAHKNQSEQPASVEGSSPPAEISSGDAASAESAETQTAALSDEDAAAVHFVRDIMDRALRVATDAPDAASAAFAARLARTFAEMIERKAREQDARLDGEAARASHSAVPAERDARLDGDDVDTLLTALVEAVQAWRPRDDLYRHEVEVRRLERLGRALVVASRAHLAVMQPIADASRENHRVARRWEKARWMGRSQASHAGTQE